MDLTSVNDKAGCQYKTARTAFVKSYVFIYLVVDFISGMTCYEKQDVKMILPADNCYQFWLRSYL